MYTLTLTEKQAETLMIASEVLARLGIGQFRDALGWLPRREEFPEGWHDEMAAIGRMLSRHMIGAVDGYQSSLGIHNDDVRPTPRIAWDLYQVIRHRLAWDKAVAEGVVDSPDAPRKWPAMLGVHYDEPMKSSAEPLAEIRRVDDPTPPLDTRRAR